MYRGHSLRQSNGKRTELEEESSYKFWCKAKGRGQPEGHKMAVESQRNLAMPLRHF